MIGLFFFLYTIWEIWKDPVRHISLASKGLVAAGKVIARTTQTRGKKSSYRVEYEFFAGKHYYVSMAVAKKDYDRIKKGDSVTVLYDQRNPQKSVIYEYSFFKCRQ